MYNSLVLIGCGGTSQGSGIMISYHSKKYILTTGHVIRAIPDLTELWALPNVRQTMYPQYGYPGIKIGKIHQYPNDIVVCEIAGIASDADLTIKSEPGWNITKTIVGKCFETLPFIEIEKCIFKGELSTGDTIQCIGYPVDFMVPLLAFNNKDIPLPPLMVKGIIKNTSVSELEQYGCPKEISEIVMTAWVDRQIDPRGFSGGLVLHNNQFAGVIAGGIVSENTKSGDVVFIISVEIENILAGLERFYSPHFN